MAEDGVRGTRRWRDVQRISDVLLLLLQRLSQQLRLGRRLSRQQLRRWSLLSILLLRIRLGLGLGLGSVSDMLMLGSKHRRRYSIRGERLLLGRAGRRRVAVGGSAPDLGCPCKTWPSRPEDRDTRGP